MNKETEYEKEIRILLEAGATIATEEELMIGTNTTRKIKPDGLTPPTV